MIYWRRISVARKSALLLFLLLQQNTFPYHPANTINISLIICLLLLNIPDFERIHHIRMDCARRWSRFFCSTPDDDGWTGAGWRGGTVKLWRVWRHATTNRFTLIVVFRLKKGSPLINLPVINNVVYCGLGMKRTFSSLCFRGDATVLFEAKYLKVLFSKIILFLLY